MRRSLIAASLISQITARDAPLTLLADTKAKCLDGRVLGVPPPCTASRSPLSLYQKSCVQYGFTLTPTTTHITLGVTWTRC